MFGFVTAGVRACWLTLGEANTLLRAAEGAVKLHELDLRQKAANANTPAGPSGGEL